jgi:hypothetical protein
MSERNTILELTPEAMQTISRMRQRVEDVAMQYGHTSEEHIEMLRSYTNALENVLRLGGKIYRDAELSLLGVSFITYGVIFHRKHHEGTPDELLRDWSVHS